MSKNFYEVRDTSGELFGFYKTLMRVFHEYEIEGDERKRIKAEIEREQQSMFDNLYIYPRHFS